MSRTGPWGRDFPGPLQALQTELGKLIDEYWAPGRFGAPHTDIDGGGWAPPVDVIETAEGYVVTVEVPGVSPETIDLSVTGRALAIRGAKPADETQPQSARRRASLRPLPPRGRPPRRFRFRVGPGGGPARRLVHPTSQARVVEATDHPRTVPLTVGGPPTIFEVIR